MNTYRVIGTLEKEGFAAWSVNQEINAKTEQAAIDQFEVDGWEWKNRPLIQFISEAMKLERSGQPSLFDLDMEEG